MAQGKFTKEEAIATIEAVDQLFNALPKSKQPAFLEAAQAAAPKEEK